MRRPIKVNIFLAVIDRNKIKFHQIWTWNSLPLSCMCFALCCVSPPTSSFPRLTTGRKRAWGRGSGYPLCWAAVKEEGRQGESRLPSVSRACSDLFPFLTHHPTPHPHLGSSLPPAGALPLSFSAQAPPQAELLCPSFLTETHTCQISGCPLKRITGFKSLQKWLCQRSPFCSHKAPVTLWLSLILWSFIMSVPGW